MLVTDAPFNGASELIARDQQVDAGYRDVLRVLMDTSIPKRTSPKSKPRFIYDQTELQRLLRDQLKSMGWRHGQALSADFAYDDVVMPGVRADMVGFGCHVILEFGNRASWAHNLLTRGVGSVTEADVSLIVFVAPVASLADQIDSNLATFERVAAFISWLERKAPACLPSAIAVIGVNEDLKRGIES